MKKANLTFFIAIVLTFGIILGFSMSNRKPGDKTPNSSRNNNSKSTTVKDSKNPQMQQDNNSTPNKTYGVAYYTDHFDGVNDTAALISRNYKVYRNGTFSGTPSTNFWFTGNTAVFTPQAGAGYVASNYQTAGDLGNIDNWLVLPKKNIAAGDSLFFWSRSPGTTYPDSIRVLYSAAGDSTTSGTYTELSRFRTNGTAWEKRGFRAPAAGANARFVIRYSIVNGGLNGANSDYIGIDELTIESPPIPADVGVQSINAPVGSITLPTSSMTPNATIKNFGTTSQTFNVTMTINPGGYSSTQTITGLAGGATQVANFTGYTPLAGLHTVRVYTQLAADGNKLNDTLVTTYSAYNPNFGGTGAYNNSSYFYANSTPGASGAPSQPAFCRIDTTGSTTLESNNTIVAPMSVGAANLDDGHWTLYQPGGPTRKVKFDGVVYDSVFVGTNGLICFTNFVASGNYNPPAAGLPGNGAGGTTRPGIYALWNDMDLGNTAQPDNRLSWKVDAAKNQLIITYDKAPIYLGTVSDYVTMQIAIQLQLDTVNAPNSNIVISLDNSTTNFNLPALVGIQNSTGSSYAQYFFYNSVPTLVTAGPVPVVDTTLVGGVSIAYGPNSSLLLGNCKELQLKALVEGFWNSGVNTPDTMKIEVRSSVSPYAIVDVQYAVNDASGNCSADLSNVNNGTAYYITARNRNSLETWSSVTLSWTSMIKNYDFTTASNKAYGDNMAFKDAKWTLYSGDVNGDGTIDAGDLSSVENDAGIGLTGYIPTDLNGDDIADASDLSIVENNSGLGINVITP